MTAAAAAVSVFSPASFAADELNVGPGRTAAGGGVALHGYDPVAYFTMRKPTRGLPQFETRQGDATYRFASKANQDAFAKSPAKYEPQYGGFCAYGVSVNKKFDGDPLNWTVSGDKLYLNLSPEIQTKFRKDLGGNIAKATDNWTNIEHSAANSL
ncbi:MAG: hypothetical protein K2Q06_06995 [Parvularculaceae bacterium]|nr:hypothetical protein [Parvularculaceae bacterium]